MAEYVGLVGGSNPSPSIAENEKEPYRTRATGAPSASELGPKCPRVDRVARPTPQAGSCLRGDLFNRGTPGGKLHEHER